jgi:hypothetical protein
MSGTLPSDGSPILKDVNIVGTDGTTVIVKANQKTIYNDKPTRYFESTIEPTNDIIYQFLFPKDTVFNKDGSQFTTPSKSVYIFSETDIIQQEGSIIKNVKKGTIEITPPLEAIVNAVGESVSNTLSDAENQATTFIDNTVLLQNTLIGGLSELGLLKDNPFKAILMIIYKLVMDMIVVLIFWILFVSIGCWLKIPNDLVYPINPDSYPFVYYGDKNPNKEETYYNFLQSEKDNLCKAVSKEDTEKNRGKQNDLFSRLKGLSDQDKSILNVVYNDMMKMDIKGVQKLSSVLTDKCSKTELCTMDYLTYFFCNIVFSNYLYCNYVTGMLHKGCAFLSNDVFGLFGTTISMVGFAALLYYLFLGVGAMNTKVMAKLKIKLQEETTTKAMLMNQMIRLFVSVISSCLAVIIPLCSILVITSLLTTGYTLCKSCLFPFNNTILIVAFLTFFFSVSQYVYIIKKLVSGTNVFDLMERMYVKDFSIRTFFSFLGITVPILFGVGYGCYIGFFLFFSFFQLAKHPDVSAIIKRTSASVVLVGLMILLLHVQEILGNTYVMMTFFIIVLVGIYVMSKK